MADKRKDTELTDETDKKRKLSDWEVECQNIRECPTRLEEFVSKLKKIKSKVDREWTWHEPPLAVNYGEPDEEYDMGSYQVCGFKFASGPELVSFVVSIHENEWRVTDRDGNEAEADSLSNMDAVADAMNEAVQEENDDNDEEDD